MTHISEASFKTPEFQNSLCEITKGGNQVMIYGWGHCGFYEMIIATDAAIEDARRSTSIRPIKRLFAFDLGKRPVHKLSTSAITSLEGRRMNLIDYDYSKGGLKETSRQCKTALTNLVLENYKRQQEGLSLIPIVFAIDITKNPKPCRSRNICSKMSRVNDQVTHKELRRAFKLCSHPNPKIRAIALQTFKFVKVNVLKDRVTLEQIPAPWATSVNSPGKVSSTFAACWKARKKSSASKPKHEKYDWRKQLESQTSRYDRLNQLKALMAKSAIQTKRRLDEISQESY